jgi:hypothetical protein
VSIALAAHSNTTHDSHRSPASELSVPPDLKAKSIRYSHQIMS